MINRQYNGLTSKFEHDKTYSSAEVDAGLRELNLSGEGLLGRLKGFINKRAMHGEFGGKGFLLGPGIKWASFKYIGNKNYKFELGYEDM